MAERQPWLEEEMVKLAGLIEQTKAKLEERFGLLYMKGKLKELSPSEKQELTALREKIQDLQECCEKFQQDSAEACGIDDNSLQPIERRPYKGRKAANQDDSGYYSKFLPTPKSSASRLSGASVESLRISQLAINTNAVLPEQAGGVNQTASSVSGNIENDVTDIINITSDDNTARKEVASFYLSTPSSSTASLSTPDDKIVYPPDISNLNTDENSTSAVANETNEGLNNLSKKSSNSSNEDNTEQK